GCLGALDGTYIDVRVPSTDKARYRNRKSSVCVNVLGVFYKNINFVYMLCGWEGSAADSRVLRDAVTRSHGLSVPNGEFIIIGIMMKPILSCNNIVCTGITMDYSFSHESGRASSSQTTRRRVWSPAEEQSLIDILKDMVNEEWRAENSFRQGYIFEIERRLKLKFPNCTIRADPYISSKIHVWRKNYVSALIKRTSGFGWNELTKTFSCDDPVRIAWLKAT
ncbi:Unknown protein, partial [Striga hermonthica]